MSALTGRPVDVFPASSAHRQEALGPAWTAIAVPDTYSKRKAHGCCWDSVNDKIYMYGGDTLRDCLCYDPTANSWDTVAPMSIARVWIKGICCRGDIYAISGMNNSGWQSSVEEYNPTTNIWRFRANIPTPEIVYEAVVYHDSIILVLGGSPDGVSTDSEVQIFNPATDTWVSGTSMSTGIDMSDACIIGDTIYIPGGVNRSLGYYYGVMWTGAINPTNPTQITWGRETEEIAGGPRFLGPCVALNGEVYYFGGFKSDLGPATDSGYVFNPATGTYDTLPVYPTPVGTCCLATARDSADEIYGLGGTLGDSLDTYAGYYRLSLATAVEEGKSPAVWRMLPVPTVVRGVLCLPAASSSKPQTSGCLLDISGRKVLDLKPGANDVSRLAPGVYFVKGPEVEDGRRMAVRKVVLTK
jgi:hypothetical protein